MAKASAALDERLKAVLACPFCKGPVEFHEQWSEVWCLSCRLAWPIQDGVPALVLASSRPVRP